ncbi:MAG TPA: PVC-type heme-binding CxxCH protein, partial [Verrucomicrobiae bacterium]|nr:PVC-type heme-binding CxxCH protein [Verrucomicrobiae bacterium]
MNTFTWGPDGWLYGCHGVFTHSNVGKPGAPKNERTPMTAGVWRYHPTRHIFERFSEGTSNPWGADFDEHGQCIIEACVIPHLWHMIQGGRYQRQGGQHEEPYTFDDIKTIADHLHYRGNQWDDSDRLSSRSLGGGHAHAGLMVYLGGSWPEQYRGQFFMNNIHGACINLDYPERQGSGFVGHHNPDFISFNDSWSQIINLQYDQNGSMYMIDWYDKNQCHSTRMDAADRSNGRIFKITYGGTKWTPVDLEKLSDNELIKLLSNQNEWYARHARRALQERGPNPKVHESLLKILNGGADGTVKLRALWTLHVTGGLTEKIALAQLKNRDEYIRAWSIQFLAENKNVSPGGLREFIRMAREDKSPVVRLYLASALQRVPAEHRWDTVTALDSHAEDAKDHNLPLMYWYAAEPLAALDVDRALKLAESSKIPRMLHFTARRVATIGTPAAFIAVIESFGRASDDSRRLDILRGLGLALQGQRHAAMPAGWNDVEAKLNTLASAEIRAQVQSLSLIFGSGNALTALRKTLSDESADASARRTAMDSLLAAHDPNLAPLLQAVLDNRELQGPALRGLAA